MPKPRKSYALWITGHVLRLLATLLVAAVCFFMIWRVFISSNPPSDMKRLAANEQLAAAYRTHGEKLHLFTQEQGTVTRAENNSGYFGYTMAVFIPDAAQVQVVFRYNDSTLEHVKEDLGLAEVPQKGTEVFDVTLVRIVDTTPEDKSDNTDGNANLRKERIAPTSREIDTTLLYTYVRYTFDGTVMTEDTVTAFLDVYHKDNVNYEAEAMGTLRIYHTESADLRVELSGKEKKALEDYES